MRFTKSTALKSNTPTTYDQLPPIEEMTTEELMGLPFAVRQNILRDAVADMKSENTPDVPQ